MKVDMLLNKETKSGIHFLVNLQITVIRYIYWPKEKVLTFKRGKRGSHQGGFSDNNQWETMLLQDVANCIESKFLKE